MANIFDTGQKVGDPFSADTAILQFNGGSADLAVVQSFAAQGAQQVSPMWDLASNNVHVIKGRSSYSASMGQVVGPKKLSLQLLDQYQDVCNIAENYMLMSLVNKCKASATSRVGLEGVVLVGVSFTVNVNTLVMTQGMNFLALNMTVE